MERQDLKLLFPRGVEEVNEYHASPVRALNAPPGLSQHVVDGEGILTGVDLVQSLANESESSNEQQVQGDYRVRGLIRSLPLSGFLRLVKCRSSPHRAQVECFRSITYHKMEAGAIMSMTRGNLLNFLRPPRLYPSAL